MGISVTFNLYSDSDSETRVTVGDESSGIEGIDSYDTGPASTSGQAAFATGGAAHVPSPSSSEPPPFLPESVDVSVGPDSSSGDLSAGPAPGIEDIVSGRAAATAMGGTP